MIKVYSLKNVIWLVWRCKSRWCYTRRQV